MSQTETWYIVKQATGHCKILPANQVTAPEETASGPSEREQWGPFTSVQEAIARRVGLIRSGKCQPEP